MMTDADLAAIEARASTVQSEDVALLQFYLSEVPALVAEVRRLHAVCRDKEGHLSGYRKAADEDRAVIRGLRSVLKDIDLCIKSGNRAQARDLITAALDSAPQD